MYQDVIPLSRQINMTAFTQDHRFDGFINRLAYEFIHSIRKTAFLQFRLEYTTLMPCGDD